MAVTDRLVGPDAEELSAAHGTDLPGGDGPKRPRPAAGWGKREAVSIDLEKWYDPDKGFRAEDTRISSLEFAKRFATLPEGSEDKLTEKHIITVPGQGPYIPVGAAGQFLEWNADGKRWKPVLLHSATEIKAHREGTNGKATSDKLRESFGGDWDTGSEMFSFPGGDASRLWDTEFIPIMAGPWNKQLYIADYLYMNARAFEQTNHSSLAAAAVKIMQRFALGRGLNFHIKHDEAREIWTEFWDANGMQNKLRLQTRDLTWQGEIMWKIHEPKKGYTQVRPIDPSGCWEIVTDPEDIDRCLDGSTRIALLDGSQPTLRNLARRKISPTCPVWTYSYDPRTGYVVPGKIVRCWKQPAKKRCVEVTLDNGQKIIASFDHPFMLRDGSYQPAERLCPATSLMPLYRKKDSNGYEQLWQPNSDGQSQWMMTHRWVSAQMTGEAMNRGKIVVHHRNGKPEDNRPENLERISRSAHQREHWYRNWERPEWRKEILARLAAYSHDPAVRKKSAASLRRAWADPVTSAAWRAAIAAGCQSPERRRKLIARNKLRWANPAARAAAAETMRVLWADPAMRKRFERTIRMGCKNLERNRKISEAKKAFWADATKAAKASQAMRQAWRSGRAARVLAIQESWTPARHRAQSKATTRWWRTRKAMPNNHRVVSVRPVGERSVYDVEVERHHNFALAAGVFTHNTYFYHFQYNSAYQIWVTGKIPVSKYIIQQIPPTNIQHLKINCSSQEKRGRSDLFAGMPWIKRYQDYYSGATVKAIMEANLVNIITVEGDDADVQRIRNDPNLTILPPPGSVWVQNAMVKLAPTTALMSSGRGATGIGSELVEAFATSVNLPAEYFNSSGGRGSARATALVRTDPAVKTIEDRQQVIREDVENLYLRVITSAYNAGRLNKHAAKEEPEFRRDGWQDGTEEPKDGGDGSPRARLLAVRS